MIAIHPRQSSPKTKDGDYLIRELKQSYTDMCPNLDIRPLMEPAQGCKNKVQFSKVVNALHHSEFNTS